MSDIYDPTLPTARLASGRSIGVLHGFEGFGALAPLPPYVDPYTYASGGFGATMTQSEASALTSAFRDAVRRLDRATADLGKMRAALGDAHPDFVEMRDRRNAVWYEVEALKRRIDRGLYEDTELTGAVDRIIDAVKSFHEELLRRMDVLLPSIGTELSKAREQIIGEAGRGVRWVAIGLAVAAGVAFVVWRRPGGAR